jgi:hypothetical protein
MIEQGPHRPVGWRGQQRLATYADLHELFALQATLDACVPGIVPCEATVRQAVVALDPSWQPHITAPREALKTGGVPDEDLNPELALHLLVLYNNACKDGWPVCLSTDSDGAHYDPSLLLNFHRSPKKLREVLLSSMPHGDYRSPWPILCWLRRPNFNICARAKDGRDVTQS